MCLAGAQVRFRLVGGCSGWWLRGCCPAPKYGIVSVRLVLLQAGAVKVQVFTLHDGESLVMMGAAGQCCTYILFGPVGRSCIRVCTCMCPELP